jgi:hypothetical protein
VLGIGTKRNRSEKNIDESCDFAFKHSFFERFLGVTTQKSSSVFAKNGSGAILIGSNGVRKICLETELFGFKPAKSRFSRVYRVESGERPARWFGKVGKPGGRTQASYGLKDAPFKTITPSGFRIGKESL